MGCFLTIVPPGPLNRISWQSRGELLSVSHQVHGLRIAANRAIPGLVPLAQEHPQCDLRVRLGGAPAFLYSATASAADVFYTSPSPDSDGQPSLRVATLANGAYVGFF